jgi:hypothetical protein
VVEVELAAVANLDRLRQRCLGVLAAMEGGMSTGDKEKSRMGGMGGDAGEQRE